MRPINTSFTNPLGLEKHLPLEDKDINIFAILNIVLVVMGFFMLNSRFLAAPGLELELPRLGTSITSSVVTELVLTVTDSNLLLFDGRIYSFTTIESALQEARQELKDANSILLLKMDHRVAIETLLKICEMAHQAGFTRVQIASMPTQGESENTWAATTSFNHQ